MRGYGKYFIFIIVVLLIVLWISGFFRKKIDSGRVAPQPRVVKGLKFEEVRVLHEVENAYFGEIEAENRAEVSTKIMGKILDIRVKEGDCVKAGALLATIEGEDIYAQLESLEHRIKQAEAEYRATLAQKEAESKTFERYKKLVKEGAVTPQEFDEVKARYEATLENVERAKAGITSLKAQKKAITAQLNYLHLRAPFSGCVIKKNADPGDMAIPGQPILVLERSPYRAKFELPAHYFSQISLGTELALQVEGSSEVIKGKVIEKTPAIDVKTQTFTIKLLLPVKGFRSGQVAKVYIPEKRKVLAVPESALVKRYDFTGVFVVKQDKVLELRYVKLGEKRGSLMEVLSGLAEGEKIVVEGVDRACDGCILE